MKFCEPEPGVAWNTHLVCPTLYVLTPVFSDAVSTKLPSPLDEIASPDWNVPTTSCK